MDAGAEGAAHTSAPHRPAASFLSLPLCAPDVPARVTPSGGNESKRRLASALLDLDVLRNDDWNGDVASSLHAGLVRWIHEELGAGEIREIDLAFGYTDDLEEISYLSRHWRPNAGGHEGAVGGFFLEGTAYNEVFCKSAVTTWECRAKGLGLGLMALACRALWATIGCASPAWAEGECEDREMTDGGYSDEEAERDDIPTLSRLYKRLPRKVIDATFDPSVAEKALGRKRLPLTLGEKHVVEDALELHHKVAAFLDTVRHQNHAYTWDDTFPVLPVAIRWNRDDWIDRFSDDYHENLASAGEETRLLYLTAWQEGSQYPLAQAVGAIGRAVEIVVGADRLLQQISGEWPPERGKTLAEVFAAEQAEELRAEAQAERVRGRT